MVILVIFVCGIAVWRFQVAPDGARVSLFNGKIMPGVRLGRMVQAFSKAKLNGYSIEQGRVYVPAKQTARYLAVLADAEALPREFQSHMADAMQVNKLFETERERSQRLLYARERDLALAIQEMPGIENAMVQYDENVERGFHSKRVVTASVSILPADGHVLDRRQILTIRQLVTLSKAGLSMEEVCVIDLRSGRAYVNGAEQDTPLPMAHEYLNIKRAVEAEWKRKVSEAISFLPDPRVAVNVDLKTVEGGEKVVSPEPRGIAVTVSVPATYYRELARSNFQQQTHETTEHGSQDSWEVIRHQVKSQIQDAVSSLLVPMPDVVSSVSVNQYGQAALQPSWAPKDYLAGLWSQHRQATVIVLLIGVFIVGIPLVRRRSRETHAAGTIPMQSFRDVQAASSTSPTDLDDTQLRTTLSDLVREDPDVAADILHQWIDRAG